MISINSQMMSKMQSVPMEDHLESEYDEFISVVGAVLVKITGFYPSILSQLFEHLVVNTKSIDENVISPVGNFSIS
jgi:hypothetical protein